MPSAVNVCPLLMLLVACANVITLVSVIVLLLSAYYARPLVVFRSCSSASDSYRRTPAPWSSRSSLLEPYQFAVLVDLPGQFILTHPMHPGSISIFKVIPSLRFDCFHCSVLLTILLLHPDRVSSIRTIRACCRGSA